MSDLKTISIGQIDVIPFQSYEEVLSLIINEGRIIPGFAMAINAEKVVMSMKNDKVKELTRKASICYADGIAVVSAIRKKGQKNVRITGCDLWEKLMVLSGENNVPVYLLGAKNEVLKGTKKKLREKYHVNVVGSTDGYFKNEEDVIKDIFLKKPMVVSVAMGSPRQEEFIQKCQEIYPDAFYMGLGGTFDVFWGNVKRAPLWVQKLNLEWLFRLLSNPMRVARQTALFEYAWLYVRKKL